MVIYMSKNIGKNIGIIVLAAFIIQLIFKLMGNSESAVIIRAAILMVICIILLLVAFLL